MDRSKLPRTKQAQGYAELWRTVYGVDTRVYKDGGTVEYYNTATRDTTTLASTARAWFESGNEVFLTRSCNPTVFEVWNARKRTRKALAGNGRVAYKYNS